MADILDADFAAAEDEGRKRLATDPRAAGVYFDRANERVVIELLNGCTYAFPPRLVQDLQGSSIDDLTEVEVDGLGFNLHWPRLDVDLFVPALVAGLFGTRAWMAREFARAAGRSTSPAKAAAARSNGAKGGRPRKSSSG